jgi:DNA helicase HerA-like ATPase
MSFFLGKKKDGTPIEIPPAALLRHAVSLGASGSGKTVAMKALCEEAARHGIPVIALDPQGDIASLGLPGDREKVLAKGVPPDVYDGYRDRHEVVVWTPASTDGVPIAVNPLRGRFEGAESETITKALSAQAEAIAALAGVSSKSAVAFLHVVLEHLQREKKELGDFGELADFIETSMPARLQEEVAELASPALIRELTQQLRVATVGARGLLFRMGAPIDIDLLLGRTEATPGKTRVSVIYLNTLSSQEEKDFFVQMVVTALYQWMLRHPSPDLQALFYIDEIAPYLPPVRKPACKEALQLLFKQARKFGIGCLAATQNPGDLDYKALGQVSSWNLGRVIVKQDLKKIEKFFQARAPLSAPAIMRRLPALQPGEFVLLAPDVFEGVEEYDVRWLASEHRTLESGDLGRVTPPDLKARLLRGREAFPPEKRPEKPAPAAVAAAAAPQGARPEPSAAPPAPPAAPAVELASPGDEAVLSVRALLEKERGILTRREIGERTGLTPARVERALARLEADGLARRYEHARAHGFSWHTVKLRPDLGLFEPTERFKTKVFEDRARAIAEDDLETSFFMKQERIAAARFFYFPLLKVHFRATKEKGWIFKQKEVGTENIYLHPATCDIVHCEGGRVDFRPTPSGHPLDLVDLDHAGELEPVQPGDLDLRPEDFEKALPLEEARARASRKFPFEVLSISHAFLPCWELAIERKEGARRRSLFVDGVLGSKIAI